MDLNASKLSFILIACTLLSSVSCTTLRFKDCGSQVGKISTIKTSPDVAQEGKMYVLRKGVDYTVNVTFTSTESTKTAHAQVYGIVAGIPVPFSLPNADGCKDSGITCPIQQGQTYVYSATLPVSKLYPSVKVVVKWELYDHSTDTGNKLFCFESGFAVKGWIQFGTQNRYSKQWKLSYTASHHITNHSVEFWVFLTKYFAGLAFWCIDAATL